MARRLTTNQEIADGRVGLRRQVKVYLDSTTSNSFLVSQEAWVRIPLLSCYFCFLFISLAFWCNW
ncbi:hypothetical protein N7455_008933 [Penicillium solitum]|uniref:uncharacterized protein n=1 Tax=Penicillium solitum TaxID=60172 RepID=UPI0032C48576|nr:hypothetical protein N7455_008933 [Penicillium solitum]